MLGRIWFWIVLELEFLGCWSWFCRCYVVCWEMVWVIWFRVGCVFVGGLVCIDNCFFMEKEWVGWGGFLLESFFGLLRDFLGLCMEELLWWWWRCVFLIRICFCWGRLNRSILGGCLVWGDDFGCWLFVGLFLIFKGRYYYCKLCLRCLEDCCEWK